MDELQIGAFAVSTAGHDAGKCYVIFQRNHEYLYLVDGKIRTLDRPKKKKNIHMKFLAQPDPIIREKILSGSVRNEEIKRAIKMLLNKDSNREVQSS